MHRTVLMSEPRNGAMSTCSVEIGEGRGRHFAVIKKREMKREGIPARVGLCTTSENFNWLLFPDLVLRHVPKDAVEGMFRFEADGSMAADEHAALLEAAVRAGWAKDEASAEPVAAELSMEMRAMSVRVDG